MEAAKGVWNRKGTMKPVKGVFMYPRPVVLHVKRAKKVPFAPERRKLTRFGENKSPATLFSQKKPLDDRRQTSLGA
jgi:hypothetical protein